MFLILYRQTWNEAAFPFSIYPFAYPNAVAYGEPRDFIIYNAM